MKRTLILAAALVALSAGPVSAAKVDPTFHDGNPTCSDLVSSAFPVVELKVEPVASGTYTDGTLAVKVVVNQTGNGPTIDFTSEPSVDAVFVKGGPNGNLYTYPNETKSDQDLHAPVNPANGTYYGLSHLSFCYDVSHPTTTSTTRTTASTATTATSTTVTTTATLTTPVTTTATETVPVVVTTPVTTTVTAPVTTTARETVSTTETATETSTALVPAPPVNTPELTLPPTDAAPAGSDGGAPPIGTMLVLFGAAFLVLAAAIRKGAAR